MKVGEIRDAGLGAKKVCGYVCSAEDGPHLPAGTNDVIMMPSDIITTSGATWPDSTRKCYLRGQSYNIIDETYQKCELYTETPNKQQWQIFCASSVNKRGMKKQHSLICKSNKWSYISA